MRHFTLWAFTFALIFTAATLTDAPILGLSVVDAQEIPANMEYGDIAELRGITRVYVYTGPEKDLRDKMATYIKEKLPQVIITNSSKDADVMVSFSRVAGYDSAVGIVVRFAVNGRVRLLMNWHETKGRVLGRDLVKKFADKFIKAYVDANKSNELTIRAEADPLLIEAERVIAWQEIKGARELELYYSPESVSRSRVGITRVWVKLVYKPGSELRTHYIDLRKEADLSIEGYDKHSYSKQLIEIDCPARKARTVYMVDYTLHDKVLGTISEDDSFKPFGTDGIVGPIASKICSPKASESRHETSSGAANNIAGTYTGTWPSDRYKARH